jgi:hypothetical protein
VLLFLLLFPLLFPLLRVLLTMTVVAHPVPRLAHDLVCLAAYAVVVGVVPVAAVCGFVFLCVAAAKIVCVFCMVHIAAVGVVCGLGLDIGLDMWGAVV